MWIPRRFSAVLFDLDGTLVNSLADIADAANQALASQGFPGHPVDHYRYLVGDGARVLMARALPAPDRVPATVSRLLPLFLDAYEQNLVNRSHLYDGIPALLDRLTALGLKLAVVSNKPHPLAEKVAAALLASWPFAAILGQQPDLPRKPDPAAPLIAARAMGSDPQRVLYLGDSAVDMQAARAAGMYPVGVLWGFRPAAELEKGGARRLIEHPLELFTPADDVSAS